MANVQEIPVPREIGAARRAGSGRTPRGRPRCRSGPRNRCGPRRCVMRSAAAKFERLAPERGGNDTNITRPDADR